MRYLSLFVLLYFFTNYSQAQNKSQALETSINNYEIATRYINYERKLSSGYDNEYGRYFKTLYNFYDPDGSPGAQVNIVNFTEKRIIEIYIFPYVHGVRQDEWMKFYSIDPDLFEGLIYVEEGDDTYINNENNVKKKKLKIAYLSTKKENLKIYEIYTKLFDVHYQIEKDPVQGENYSQQRSYVVGEFNSRYSMFFKSEKYVLNSLDEKSNLKNIKSGMTDEGLNYVTAVDDNNVYAWFFNENGVHKYVVSTFRENTNAMIKYMDKTFIKGEAMEWFDYMGKIKIYYHLTVDQKWCTMSVQVR